jgi:hypothetical protein
LYEGSKAVLIADKPSLFETIRFHELEIAVKDNQQELRRRAEAAQVVAGMILPPPWPFQFVWVLNFGFELAKQRYLAKQRCLDS